MSKANHEESTYSADSYQYTFIGLSYIMTTFSISHLPVSSLPQVPRQILDGTINEMKDACASKNAGRLYEILLTIPRGNIFDLDPVFMEAVKQECPEIVSDLIRWGFPIHSDHALEAIKYRSNVILSIFLQNGWKINAPISQLKPPVLG